MRGALFYMQTFANEGQMRYNSVMTVFVIAMKSEAIPVLENMRVESERNVHGREVFAGTLYGEKCAVIVCGVGKVNAAAGAQYAIDCLSADKIINVGVAGGLNGGTRIAEIYAISECVQYDFDLVAINGTTVGTLNEYDKPYLPLAIAGNYGQKRLATGDRFNDDEGDYNLLTSVLNADIRDMEGGAIAHVCRHADVPCYMFKAISDVAGAGSTGEQFVQNLNKCADRLRGEIQRIFTAVNG